jgi:DNA-binding CsgD family transcriptional regulator
MAVNWWVVVDPGTSNNRLVPVHHRLVVGRECVGVAPDLRLILDDRSVSRHHLEIRIAPDGGMTLTDASTNGTRVNGSKVQRGATVALRDGDLIELGDRKLAVRFSPGDAADDELVRATIHKLKRGMLTVVSGDPLRELTARELEVLALVAQGNSNAAIAERLVLSPRTVDNHIRRIMQALGLPETSEDNRRVQAVLTYLRAVAVADEHAAGTGD